VLLGGALLTGCGGGDGGEATDDGTAAAASSGDYCALVKELTEQTKASIAEPDQDYTEADLARDKERLTTIAAAAPKAVSADWKTLVEASRKTQKVFQAALKAAGIGFDEFMKAQRTGQVPDGITAEQMSAISATMQGPADEAGAEAATKASKAVTAHAKKACDVDMSLGE
jgi:hypothetical protein